MKKREFHYLQLLLLLLCIIQTIIQTPSAAMAQRQQQQCGRKQLPNVIINENRQLSPLSLATLQAIQQKRRPGKSQSEGTTSVIHDNTSMGYEWLLPGWLAEERHMKSGRIYRYYYDPSGRLYQTQSEVVLAWEQSGMVVLDV